MTLLNLRAPATLRRALVYFFRTTKTLSNQKGQIGTAEKKKVNSINQVLGNLWINASNATLSSVCSHWINTSNATLSSVVIPDFIMTGFRNWFSDSWLSPETLNSSFFLPSGLRVQIVRTIKKNDNLTRFFFSSLKIALPPLGWLMSQIYLNIPVLAASHTKLLAKGSMY